MKSSVEALSRTSSVKGKTAGLVFRQSHEPTPVAVVDLNAPAPAARRVVAKIREHENKRGCGTYVYVNPQLQVFAVSEEASSAPRWMNEHFGWLVGFYRTVRPAHKRIPVLAVTAGGIAEDLVEQVEQMRVKR